MLKQLFCGCKPKDQTVMESHNDVLTCICENCNKITYLGTVKLDDDRVIGVSARKHLPEKYFKVMMHYLAKRELGNMLPDIDDLNGIMEAIKKDIEENGVPKNFNPDCTCPRCTELKEKANEAKAKADSAPNN